MFERVLVANRGEIARRVLRTSRRLGIRTVAVFVEGDELHARDADEARPIPSYLDVEAIVAAAADCDAVHPGYGFLSENPAFARACADAGVTFVGPSAQAMELMGDKVRAKEVAVAAGVPVVPTYSLEDARSSTAYPLLVKAVAGGGGRGMRVVDDPSGLDEAVAAARREAAAGFGDDRVFVEKYLPRARHIEVQLLGDIALGERECSLQRRHQKLVEEAPSPAVSEELRKQLNDEASSLALAAGYENAGTVEFICDADDPREHYFLEMNTRLQVEHPVTEMVTGLDLVECQLRIASGESVESDGELRGHAIEARVNAEDARWLPQMGTVLRYNRPPGVRVDDGIEEGSVVGGDYDSLLAKVIVHGEDRADALAKLDRALAQTTILGVVTNVGPLRNLLADPAVQAGDLTTALVGARGLPEQPSSLDRVARAAAAIEFAELGAGDGWRLGGQRAPSWWLLQVEGDEPFEIELPAGTPTPPGWHHVRDADTLWLAHEGHVWRVREPAIEETQHAAAMGTLTAPMPGLVLSLDAAVGDAVSAGQTVLVLESMKMELAITAPADGLIERIEVSAGDRVKERQILVSFA
ncbi:MAG: biotin carboxylase N-terminal domain-containing protein [Solirubrobacteraceae bacterium]